MVKKYFFSLVFVFIFYLSNAQIETFYLHGSSDIAIVDDYLYFVDNTYQIKRADISNPLFLAPPSTLIFDADEEPSFDEGEGIFSFGIKDDNLYFAVGQFLINSRIYEINLTDLDTDPVLAFTSYSGWILNIDFVGSWLYPIRFGFFGEYSNLDRLNTSDPLPTSVSTYIAKQTTALTVSGGSMYFAESIYTGVYTDGEIFFKNLFLDLPEVSKFTAVGIINDLLLFEGMLYFTDSEGLKRINPAEAIPTSELLISLDDYESLIKIEVKSYDTGEDYLFVTGSDMDGGLILRVNLNDPTLSDKNNSIVNITLFPNPTINNVTITSNYHLEKISVYDFLGKEIKEEFLVNNTKSYNIDIIDLSSGSYFLKIMTSAGLETKKIIKQ